MNSVSPPFPTSLVYDSGRFVKSQFHTYCWRLCKDTEIPSFPTRVL